MLSESATSQIIAFPAHTAAPEVSLQAAQASAKPRPEEARLTRALAGRNDAVTTQRAAMTAWKVALGDLRTITSRLGDSLRGYNDSLGHLDARVKTLCAGAVKLEAWADDALARKG